MTATREQELTELVALLVAGFRAAWQGDQHWLDWRNDDTTPDPDDLIERAKKALNQEDPS